MFELGLNIPETFSNNEDIDTYIDSHHEAVLLYVYLCMAVILILTVLLVSYILLLKGTYEVFIYNYYYLPIVLLGKGTPTVNLI